MRYEILDFQSRWGYPIDPVEVSAGYFDEYAGQLPELMLDVWREVGFAGFDDGLLWVCDPHAWQPIVDVWLAGLELPEQYVGNQIPIFRTAYGKIFCFKPGLGKKLMINPFVSSVSLLRPEPVPGQRWVDMGIEDILGYPKRSFLVQASPPDGDDDDLQEDLFPRIVDRLGPTTHDTIYSFTPRWMRVENAVLAQAAPELARVRGLETPDVDTV